LLVHGPILAPGTDTENPVTLPRRPDTVVRMSALTTPFTLPAGLCLPGAVAAADSLPATSLPAASRLATGARS
jgi:hypothetical protein